MSKNKGSKKSDTEKRSGKAAFAKTGRSSKSDTGSRKAGQAAKSMSEDSTSGRATSSRQLSAMPELESQKKPGAEKKSRQTRGGTRATGATAAEVIQDGFFEVATAIALTSDLVTIVSQDPLQAIPEDLFDLTFNDPQVGISDPQMNIFKAQLGLLLPQIQERIQSDIPANSNLLILDVAQTVQLWLEQT